LDNGHFSDKFAFMEDDFHHQASTLLYYRRFEDIEWLESYDRIEQTLKDCITAQQLPANLLTRRAAILMRSYLPQTNFVATGRSDTSQSAHRHKHGLPHEG
jgi:hypothetical protein